MPDLPKIHREALKRADRAYRADQHNIDEAQDDLKFLSGEQWPKEILDERGPDRVALTINLSAQFVKQVSGNARQQRPAIKLSPVDSVSDPEKVKVMTGLVRAIERTSNAQDVYDAGMDNAVRCGMGHWRVSSQFPPEGGFYQELFVKRIKSPFAVLWDDKASMPDRSDATYCFVFDNLPMETFKERYPDAAANGFDTTYVPFDTTIQWYGQDDVRIAEYWVKEPMKRLLGLKQDGGVVDITEATEPLFDLVDTREVDSHRIRQYILSGSAVLEEHDWAGLHIPIVTMTGEEIQLEDSTYRHGVARFAKDPNREYNYWHTTATETIALQPKMPYIGTAKQVAGYEELWRDANRRNLGYLPYKPDGQAPPPSRDRPADVPVAMMEMARIAKSDMNDVVGIHNVELGKDSERRSGVAIRQLTEQGNTNSFVYLANMAIAIKHTGRILIDMIPRIYDTARMVRILGEDESERIEQVNTTVRDPESGRIFIQHDLTVGRYDVDVNIGPSFATKRQEAVESQLEFLRVYPEARQIIGDLVARNMDMPQMEEIAKRLKKALPPGIAEEEGDDEQQQPTEMEQMQAQVAQIMQELQLRGAQADVAEKEAKVEKLQAETVKVGTEAAVNMNDIEVAVRTVLRDELAQVFQISQGQQGAQLQ